jgi:poly(ADP-ribose) glycohydrolase
MSKIILFRNGFIEKDTNAIQVIFANKILGGGIFNNGLVQEEIRWLICPELFVLSLVAEELNENEVIFIHGAE